MEVTRRKIGSSVFKGMMALGAVFDLTRLVGAVENLLQGPEIISSEQAFEAGVGSDPSFKGGLGVSNAKHMLGTSKIQQGESKIMEGKALISRASRETDPGKASSLQMNGQSLINEGKRLITEGKRILKEVERMLQAAKK